MGREFVVLPKEELKQLILDAAITAANMTAERMEESHKANLKATKDRRLHNTKLLLRNYIALKSHIKEAVFDNKKDSVKLSEELNYLMQTEDSDRVIVNAIKESKERTNVIIAHVDHMLSVYKTICYKSSEREKRQYNVIRDLYMCQKKNTVMELAKKYKVSRVTIYEDIKIAEERLTTLFFGFDGLTNKNC